MRDLTAGMQSAISATEVEPILLFEGVFKNSEVYAWSGYGTILWDGKAWVGTGTFLSVSEVSENSDTSATGATVTLNGIPSPLISLTLAECKQGALGRIYFGIFSNGAVLADPLIMFEGKLDVPTIEEGAETSSITITYESRLIDLERPRLTRYTKEDQIRLFAGDKGFDYVPSIQEQNITWGRA
jgi:hypothetical protein